MNRPNSGLPRTRAVISGAITLAIAAILATQLTPAHGSGKVSTDPGVWARIDFFPNLGPTRIRSQHNTDLEPQEFDLRSPSYDAYAANAISAMLKGLPAKGGRIRSNPTAFESLRSCHRFRSGEMLAVPFDMWRGQLEPSGAFAREKGTQFRLGVRVMSNRPFVLSEVRKVYVDSFDGDDFNLAESIREFERDRAVGVHWGRNGRPGGGDDVVYDNAAHDPATTPINVFVWLGNPKFDWINQELLDELFGGDPSALLDDYRSFVAGSFGGFTPPLFFHYTYKLDSPGGASVQAEYSAQITDTLPRFCPQIDPL